MNAYDASLVLDPIFKKWGDGIYDKWDVYPKVFGMLDAGEVRLIDIMDAAHKIGIAPGVVKMRRDDSLGTGGTEAIRRGDVSHPFSTPIAATTNQGGLPQ